MFIQNYYFCLIATLFLSLAPLKSQACNDTQNVNFTAITNNGNGTFDIGMEVTIGDGGSLDGFTVDFEFFDIVGFSPATISQGTETATGTIVDGSLGYIHSGSGMFVDFNTNPTFEITITVNSTVEPSEAFAIFTGLNATATEAPGSCNLTEDSWEYFIPVIPINLTCGDIFTETTIDFNYSDEITIICPDTPGEIVMVEFLSFEVEDGDDYLRVYNSDGTSGGYTDYTGDGTLDKLYAYNSSGCLTFVFDHGTWTGSKNWEATITCLDTPVLPTGDLTCGDSFFDRGGVNDDYSNLEKYTTIICPQSSDEYVLIDFSSFNLEDNNDVLTIHDAYGLTDSGIPFSTNSPGTQIASNPTGCLTFEFQSDGSLQFSGWEATVSCNPIPQVVEMEMKIFLEGPYNEGIMNHHLGPLLPLTEPYTDLGYERGTVIGVEAIDPNTEIVDWLLIELRDAANPSVIITSKAVLLMEDGQVLDANMNSTFKFFILDATVSNFLPVVRHRNHLSVIADQNCSDNCAIDFTMANLPGQMSLGDGNYGLVAGSADGDDIVDASDRSATWNSRNRFEYLSEDVNLDCIVDAEDRSITWNNRNKSVSVP